MSLMSFWLALAVWAGLSILTIRRLMVILANLRLVVAWHWVRVLGLRVLAWPTVRTLRPLRQLLVWACEVWLLILWYSLFGESILAHVVAAVTAAVTVWLLRDRAEPNPLRAIQIMPMRQNG